MATRRHKQNLYDTYGSVAYAPAYDGSAVRAPRREEEQRRAPRPQTRERKRARELTRRQAQVREAGQVAPFAVAGFLAVTIFAVLLLGSYARLTVEYGEVVNLRNELSALQAESATLNAQYEKVFDMEKLQNEVGDTMIRPTNDQVIYIDLSEPDTVEVFDGRGDGNFLTDAIQEIGDMLNRVIEYFR